MAIPFGKYKGKSIRWVYNNDKSYYEWMTSIETFGKFNDEISKFLEKTKKERTKKIKNFLTKIDNMLKNSSKVYSQNIHCVGEGYIIGDIHLEEITGDKYSIYDWNNSISDLTKDEYDIFFNVLYPAWERNGKISVERGLY